MNPNTFYVGLRMQEWGMGEQSRRIQSSVRRVLNELTGEALLFLKDPRLEVKVLSDADLQRVAEDGGLRTSDGWKGHPSLMIGHSVWAYFPIGYIGRLLYPKPETCALLVFSAPQAKREQGKLFEDRLRDHLGHVLLYLRSPKARNDCPDAMKEWRRSIRRAA